jgi:rubrerythrin
MEHSSEACEQETASIRCEAVRSELAERERVKIMPKARYKCPDCGAVFETEKTNTKCPECKYACGPECLH